MSDTPTSRPPPEVIGVPLPDGLGARAIGLVVVAIAVIVAGIGMGFLGIVVTSWAMGLVGLLAIGLGFFIWYAARTGPESERLHKSYIQRLRRRCAGPVVMNLAERWKRRGTVPTNDAVIAALASQPAITPTRARIVCLGEIDVPEVDALFFEPEIITPTRAVGWQLVFVPIAAVVIFIWLMQVFGLIPGRGINPGSFGYILVMGVAAGAMWLWRSVLRPTYIRMAPGVIQILEFRYRRGKPDIRSYPMDAETIAILRGRAKGGKTLGLKLTLMRGGQQDTIELWRMQKRDQAIERTWHALLSTAPTPPLSDEELVG